MSDVMRPMSYEKLLRWAVSEYRKEGSIFGVKKPVRYEKGQAEAIFGERMEAPFGPAAGPHTQLAQNIAAAYAAGARFFELKTVQQMDGPDLAACVPKPCIAAEDECYNCEWSTELYVEQAFEEYVKAWFLCKILARELDLGDPDAFVFNMSVGYDLKGIQTDKIDHFIEGMKNAAGEAIFKEAVEVSERAAEEGLFENVDSAFIRSIPARVSGSITESTLHGCPPDEIERIATYLITEKGLHTFIKCNPTLLGYDFARKTLDRLGFDYVAFDDHHFVEDLQWADAVPMFERLQKLCDERGLTFGLKLTNTFPVDVKAGELPSREMYMSGRSLFPLTIALAERITGQFGGKLRISYSGGADFFNIRELTEAGIRPVTMATTILKPGGYERLAQIAGLFDGSAPAPVFAGADPGRVASLVRFSETASYYKKPIKPLPSRKNGEQLPMLDCFTSPCRGGCPIGQDIPAYLQAMEEGRPEDALRIILERNALPFTTGTICPHTCGERCMRNHYETSVHIREVKLAAAEAAFEDVLAGIRRGGAGPAAGGRKVAVIGAGPAGLAAASFLTRAGVPVTVFEKRDRAGGVPRYVIPSFRIGEEAIDRDIALCSAYGAAFVFGRQVTDARSLFEEGFTDVIAAIGAWAPGRPALKYGEAVDALDFLAELKAGQRAAGEAAAALPEVGTDVAVIGGGNTAMDVARAARRIPGVEHVRLVYRRTRRYMPADEEELEMALADGVEFMELLAPEGLADGVLTCEVMTLGEPDASGRRSPVGTGKKCQIPATCVITAVGEQVDRTLYEASGAEVDARGRVVTDDTLMTAVPHFYAIGDGRRGPATVVRAIADAQTAAAAIAGVTFGGYEEANRTEDEARAFSKKGILKKEIRPDGDDRCLMCETICQVCTDVCPNRANIAVRVPGFDKPQILHVDGMCNECGNCAVFCPYSGRPYRDKLTLYDREEDFADSDNNGFVILADGQVRVRLFGQVRDCDAARDDCGLPEGILAFIRAVQRDYPWLL